MISWMLVQHADVRWSILARLWSWKYFIIRIWYSPRFYHTQLPKLFQKRLATWYVSNRSTRSIESWIECCLKITKTRCVPDDSDGLESSSSHRKFSLLSLDRFINFIRSFCSCIITRTVRRKRIVTLSLQIWNWWRKELLRWLTTILCCIVECKKKKWFKLIVRLVSLNKANCVLRWNVDNKRWPYLWSSLTFTVSADMLFHVGIIKNS